MDFRSELQASLAHLDRALVDAKPGEIAVLIRERRAVLTQLDALPSAQESNPVDDLSALRRSRRAAAKGRGGPSEGVKRGGRGG